MTPASGLAAPARAPVGSARDLHSRIPAPRSRPLSVLLWAALLGEDGIAGAPARRRLRRFLLRSAPSALAVGGGTLVALRVFADARPGPAQAAALAGLAAGAGGLAWRGLGGLRAGRRGTWREGAELGAAALVLAAAVAQTAEGAGLAGAASLQPLVYLTLAALVAALPRPVGMGLVALALGLEGATWWGRGAPLAELPGVGVRAGFTALFAALYHGVLGARIAAGRRAEAAALDRRRRELDERARQLRLLAAAEPGEGEREEHAARLAEAAVLETDAAARGLLELAQEALSAHTAAVWILSDDDRQLDLWECRSCSDRVAAHLPAGEGALGGVVKRRAPVRLHGELRGASHYEDGTRPRALLAVPLLSRVGGYLRGVVLVDRLQPKPFEEEHERLLTRLAAELARAAAAEKLIRDGRARRHEEERFYQAIEALNRVTTPRDVFDTVILEASRMAPVDFGAVTLVAGEGERARHRVVRATLVRENRPAVDLKAPLGRAAAALEGHEFQENGGLVACAVRHDATLPAKPPRPDAVVFDEQGRLPALAWLKVLPLRAGGRVLGTLVVGAGARPRTREGDVVRQLEVLALQAADALERARLFEETERLATTDGLTGLTNHRTFQARLDEHLAAAQRYGKKVSLLLTDVDHFKSVNDTYGHPVGDVVLKGVARILQKEARTTDVAARYGGEEFALVMPETDLAGALRTAERIREKVAQARFHTEQGDLQVTISIGVATFPEDGRAKPELVERADGGLYHAKRHGRNQTVALGQLRGRKAG